MEEENKDNMEQEGAEMQTPETISQEVNDTVAECLLKLQSGEVTTKEEVIDLLVEKLEALKDVKSALGGLGDQEGMPLPEEEAPQE